MEDQGKPVAYSCAACDGGAEAAGLATAGLRAPAKVREEYSAMGQTRLAASALRTNATFMMLKSAKKSSA